MIDSIQSEFKRIKKDEKKQVDFCKDRESNKMIYDAFDQWLVETLLSAKYYRDVFQSIQQAQEAHQKVQEYNFTFYFPSQMGPYRALYDKKTLLETFVYRRRPVQTQSDQCFQLIYQWREFYESLYESLQQKRQMTLQNRETTFYVQLPNGYRMEMMDRNRQYTFRDIQQLYLSMMGGGDYSKRDNRGTYWVRIATQLCPEEAPLCFFLYQSQSIQKEIFLAGLQKKIYQGIPYLDQVSWIPRGEDLPARLYQFTQMIYQQIYFVPSIHFPEKEWKEEQELNRKVSMALRWYLFLTFLFALDERSSWKNQLYPTEFIDFVWKKLVDQDPTVLPGSLRENIFLALQEAEKKSPFVSYITSFQHCFPMSVMDASYIDLTHDCSNLYQWRFWTMWMVWERYWQMYVSTLYQPNTDSELMAECQWIYEWIRFLEQGNEYDLSYCPMEHMSIFSHWLEMSK